MRTPVITPAKIPRHCETVRVADPPTLSRHSSRSARTAAGRSGTRRRKSTGARRRPRIMCSPDSSLVVSGFGFLASACASVVRVSTPRRVPGQARARLRPSRPSGSSRGTEWTADPVVQLEDDPRLRGDMAEEQAHTSEALSQVRVDVPDDPLAPPVLVLRELVFPPTRGTREPDKPQPPQE